MAAGAPVIALGVGGALETVQDGETGVFFEESTPESLIQAIERFERVAAGISAEQCRSRAEQFTRERFQKEFRAQAQRLGFRGKSS